MGRNDDDVAIQNKMVIKNDIDEMEMKEQYRTKWRWKKNNKRRNDDDKVRQNEMLIKKMIWDEMVMKKMI